MQHAPIPRRVIVGDQVGIGLANLVAPPITRLGIGACCIFHSASVGNGSYGPSSSTARRRIAVHRPSSDYASTLIVRVRHANTGASAACDARFPLGDGYGTLGQGEPADRDAVHGIAVESPLCPSRSCRPRPAPLAGQSLHSLKVALSICVAVAPSPEPAAATCDCSPAEAHQPAAC